MEIQGKIIKACEPVGGVSKAGKSWKKQEFVIETIEQYPRKCCFGVFGEDKLKEFDIKVGDILQVSLDIDAREYNGRWYNSISAWKVERKAQAATTSAPPAQPTKVEPVKTQTFEDEDDLPF